MKKYKAILLLILLIVIFSGCAKKEPAMDQLAEDGKYHYRNDDLGFGLNFPEEFVYYQFQRMDSEKFSDIEFFVPTNDRASFSEVPSYAKVLIVRVFMDSSAWPDYKDFFDQVGEQDGKIYAIQFWSKTPTDWQDRWDSSISSEIKESFYLR